MTPPTPAPPPGGVSRRRLLTAAVALPALSLAGCRLDNPLDDRTTPAAEAVPELAPDVGLAVEVVVAIRAVATRAEATARRHTWPDDRLTGLSAMHAAHLEALIDAVPDRVDTTPGEAEVAIPAKPAVARRQLLAAERRLREQLTESALSARSGLFARLLGSMAAAIGQQLSVLDESAPA